MKIAVLNYETGEVDFLEVVGIDDSEIEDYIDSKYQRNEINWMACDEISINFKQKEYYGTEQDKYENKAKTF